MSTLWGKFHTAGKTLLGHTDDVVEAGTSLFGTPATSTRLGKRWLRMFQLPDQAREQFHWNLLAAKLLHDWGKANDGMQRVLNGRGDQKIRHEHLSALFIGLPNVWEWLKGNSALDLPLVLSAVLTHHLKASAKKDGFAHCASGDVVTLEHGDGQLDELIRTTGKNLQLSATKIPTLPQRWTAGRGGCDIREHRERVQDKVLNPLKRQSDEERRMLLAVRSALIVADAAGSGYGREQMDVTHTISECFPEEKDDRLWTGTKVWSDIIKKRTDDLNAQFAARGKGPFEWNPFQRDCDDLPERALLLAACGSGKTLAAWRWIAARAAENPVGRVLFLYPTRATAKEGFRDYVSWAPEGALMHANATFDLQGMFDNGDDPRGENRYEANRRLFSIGYWGRRAFSATVDQFLGFMQHAYGPMCMLPVLADAVVVIDEVHSFDRHMFTALKEFLRNFRVPVLCMTATLPNDRRDALTKRFEDGGCGLHVYEDADGKQAGSASLKRYALACTTRDEALRVAEDALAAGQRVLWVTNTVARCHQITARFALGPDQMRTKVGATPVYCYHSRFKLLDRNERHNGVVSAMKVGQPSAFGVTTQVCEMSLDLDVDLLITERCPVTSLIQRMGRCNRERNARPVTESGRVLVYDPGDMNPYSPDDLKGLDEFLQATTGKELSQTTLEEALAGLHEIPPWLGDNPVMFLQSGPYAVGPKSDDDEASTFREGNDFNQPCVLPNEVAEFVNERDFAKLPGYVVPVPKQLGRDRNPTDPLHNRLPKYLGVAAPDRYHPAVGYCDRPLDQWGAE